jgi:hypothetical protein
MKATKYYELFQYLMEQCSLLLEDIVFVSDISEWCADHGIHEHDKETPFKLISEDGKRLRMLIREHISDTVIHERINALWVRSQLISIAFDKADLLDSDRKIMAFLFLSEYATNLPDLQKDKLIEDDWVFSEMKRLGFLKVEDELSSR